MLDVLTGPDAWQTLRESHELTIDGALRLVVDSILLQFGVPHLGAASE